MAVALGVSEALGAGEAAAGEAEAVGEALGETRLRSGGAMLRIWLNTDGASSRLSSMVPRALGAIG